MGAQMPVPKFEGVIQGQHIAKCRCPDCGRVGHYALTKSNYKLLMHTCRHADPETGIACNAQSKMSRAKSHKVLQQFVENGHELVDLTTEFMPNVHKKERREDPKPEARDTGGGSAGGSWLDDLYAT